MSTTAGGSFEEFAGETGRDTGRGTGRGMLGNEDCIRDGSLELGQIRNHRLKGLGAEVRSAAGSGSSVGTCPAGVNYGSRLQLNRKPLQDRQPFQVE